MVGKDQFGVLLRDTLKELGIDTSHLYESEKVHTTLAFVHTLEDGDREFAFYRNPGADMMLKEEHVEVEFVRSAKAIPLWYLVHGHMRMSEKRQFTQSGQRRKAGVLRFL